MKRIKDYFCTQFPLQNFGKDFFAGIIVALVSIPISMGYAQVAGLPAVYGLYGSLLPILVFGLLSSSRQFVIGVDAMPAVMVGATLADLGVELGSERAAAVVPVISLVVALWFVVFYLLRAGRIVKYISGPVMGGFISGVGFTIILMIMPKVLGGASGTGELFALLENLIVQSPKYNLISILLGVGTILIIEVCKRVIPKVPMSVILMVLAAAAAYFFPLREMGVAMLPQAKAGLPTLILPDVSILMEHPKELLVESLLIALVVMAQTLLASNGYGQKYGFKLNHGRELLSYAAMNAASGAIGCLPVNGSVSRSGLADGFGARSHIMSVSAAVVMGLVLLFGTPVLQYLPVPVLTGIVVCALLSILDIKQAKRLWKECPEEFFIFLMAFFGVLVFGTIYGVVIGMVLSFFAVIRRAVVPPRAFLGQIPGHGNDFYNLSRNKNARAIEGAVIYRFGGNLFFGNIGTFEEDIEEAVTQETKCVIVDARGLGNIDITATDRLVLLYNNLKNRGIRFYLTEHGGQVNDQLRLYGAESLIHDGAVRRTISLALRDAGIERPYPLAGMTPLSLEDGDFVEADERLAEFEWAFGDDAEAAMEEIANQVAQKLLQEDLSISETRDIIEEAEAHSSFGRIGLFDEDEFLDYLDIKLRHMEHLSAEKREHLERHIAKRRMLIEEKLEQMNPKAETLLHEHRLKLAQHMRETHPEEYRRILAWEERHALHMQQKLQETVCKEEDRSAGRDAHKNNVENADKKVD